jgi:AraC-like DNA-binding protein
MTMPAKELTVHANRNTNVQQPPTMPVVTLRAFMGAFERLGYDKSSLLSAAGLTLAQLEDVDSRISCSALPAVICEAMRTRPLQNLGMRVAAEIPLGAFALLDYLIVTCEKVSEGIRQLARYLRIHDVPFRLDLREEEDPIRMVYTSIPDTFTAEFEVTLPVFHLRRETESRFRAEYVSFTHRPDDVDEIEQTLGCPVRTSDSWNGLAVSREAWGLPLRRRDLILHELLRRNADDVMAQLPVRDDIVSDIRRALLPRIAQGDTEIEAVARSLATSVRSLQRRLSAAGTSYQEILDSTRREAAVRYLGDRALSISEVAYLLGYSEPAAFHRAFKRWHGTTPQEFRQGQAAVADPVSFGMQ